MTLRTVCKELARTPVKTLLFLLLLALSTALLVMGVNLYVSCQAAREQVSANYKTVGTIQQKADSTLELEDEYAQMLMDSMGWYDPYAEFTVTLPDGLFDGLPTKLPVENRPSILTTAENHPVFDLEETLDVETPHRIRPYKIITFRMLMDVDTDDAEFMGQFDRLRQYSQVHFSAPVEVLSINGEACPKPMHAEMLWPTVDMEQHIVLAQGVEYTAASTVYSEDDGTLTCYLGKMGEAVRLEKGGMDIEYADRIVYENGPGFAGSDMEKGMGAFIESSKRLEAMENRLFITVPTRSLDLLGPFYQDEVSIKSGRKITQEEFESGAKVCMISEDFLAPGGDPENPDFLNILSVGDKIDLHWYGSLYGSSPAQVSPMMEWINITQAGASFEEAGGGEYEIVGIYYSGMTGMDYETGGFLNFGAYEVIVPSTSYDFESLPIMQGGPLTEGCCSFELENGTGDAFLKAVEQLEYSDLIKVTLHDQGYSSVAKGLDSIALLAVILLLAGGASSFCLLLFFVYLQIARRQREAAIQISLGAGRRRSAAFLLLSVLLVACVGIAAGGVLGHVVTDRVSGEVYAQGAQSGFSREYSDQFEASADKAFAYDGRATWQRSLLAGAAALGTAFVLAGAFTAGSLSKEPLEQLTRKE